MTVHDRPTWLGGQGVLARAVGRPLARFLEVEAAGGMVLVAAAVVGLAWANSPWSAAYHDLWATDLGIQLGRFGIEHDLRHWIDDGLMAVFFFVIGLEIKGELVTGALRTWRGALAPAAAALGGMVVPALVYTALNAGGEGGAGWGIPMATDVAFALGVLALLGDRVPAGLKVLLLALAIVDDLGAVAVIALFYTDDLDPLWGLAALAGLAAVAVLRRAGVRYLPAYLVLGAGVWLATLGSGVHATIAGVALGLLTPARPLLSAPDADRIAGRLTADPQVTAAAVRAASFDLRESVAPTERLAGLLHPWTSYVVVPLFALANAGVDLSPDRLGDALGSPVTAGVAAGLVLGKPVGILLALSAVRRLGWADLPDGVGPRHLLGMAVLAGVGFTVSTFIAGLAFDGAALVDEAKVGILTASLVAASAGALVLRRAPQPA
ncbi:MAG: Na+/H+ antiporter NhaA [Acidimicrobiia bacterium]